LIGELVSAQHQVTIVDMEAGLEHFSRSGGTLRFVDQLFIVAEPDHKALETARRTVGLAQGLGIKQIGFIGSKLRDASDEQDVMALCQGASIELAAAIPYDESVRQADRRGAALYDYDRDSITVRALEALATRLEKQFELLPSEMPATVSQAAAVAAPVVSPENVAAVTSEEKRKRFPECN
jgi:CO dehydrogenase maturation factor